MTGRTSEEEEVACYAAHLIGLPTPPIDVEGIWLGMDEIYMVCGAKLARWAGWNDGGGDDRRYWCKEHSDWWCVGPVRENYEGVKGPVCDTCKDLVRIKASQWVNNAEVRALDDYN